MDVDFNG